MKIIVQAGGLGTRMEELTRCKPKTLIPVNNKPVLFHLTDEFCRDDDEIIIIGDYKFQVLDDYVSTFLKNRRYILIKANGKGNAAGIRKALEYINDDEPVLIVWSDLIFPLGLRSRLDDLEIKGKVVIGTVDFPCSWQLLEGKLQKITGDKHGLAGFYLFNNKNQLATLPNEGSFTTWLSKMDVPMVELPLKGCIDIGTKSAYNKIETKNFRCRPYNHIEARGNVIIKTGLTNDARKLIEREVDWYLKAKDMGIKSVPDLKERNPMTIERIDGTNVFLAKLDDAQKKVVLERIIKALIDMHQHRSMRSNAWDLYQEYFGKTVQRIQSVASAIPYADRENICINGKKCHNVLKFRRLFREVVLNNLMETRYGFYHGDCQLTNILVDKDKNIYFIDPRGYFGRTSICGDVRYDWAKLYYALNGNFDQFNIKNFDLEINEDGINYSIGSGGWEYLTEEMFKQIPKEEGRKKEIELIHSIIWLSMASHAWEDFDSMCVAFYNGTYLLQDWLDKYNDKTFPIGSYVGS